MTQPTIVPVPLGERSYEIHIAAASMGALGPFVASRLDSTQAVVITDANVEEPHARCGAESLSDLQPTHLLVVDPGEPSKLPETAFALWERLLEAGVDRKSVIVAIGGGVVGDLAGFVAATFARGLPFIQVPTTLLAQVDSSVGGKVGINLPDAKNIVGAFWQPRGVLIDPEALDTLPEREYKSGLAEVVKYGVIQDEEFFAWQEAHAAEIIERESSAIAHVIARSCELKAQVVAEDEREETGRRAILNFGHTFAHAIETVTDYGEFLHGEAVAMGMIAAARLAERCGRVDAAFTSRLQSLLQAFSLPVEIPGELDADELIQIMHSDKKAQAGQLRFVLPTRLGEVELTGDVDEADVRAVLTGS